LYLDYIGCRKFFLRWQLHMMDLRAQQAKALVKSGMVTGRMEAKGFRQWKEKAEQVLLSSLTPPVPAV
jgi:hypothetical protein